MNCSPKINKYYIYMQLHEASSTIFFNFIPFQRQFLQSLTPIPFRCPSTYSVHLFLGLPTFLSPRSRQNADFLTGLLSLKRAICPAHLSPADLIRFTISGGNSLSAWFKLLPNNGFNNVNNCTCFNCCATIYPNVMQQGNYIFFFLKYIHTNRQTDTLSLLFIRFWKTENICTWNISCTSMTIYRNKITRHVPVSCLKIYANTQWWSWQFSRMPTSRKNPSCLCAALKRDGYISLNHYCIWNM
jgi:hypothetical protein